MTATSRRTAVVAEMLEPIDRVDSNRQLKGFVETITHGVPRRVLPLSER